MEPFEYPEDRGEIYGEVNEEEAWVYHTLNDFEQCIEKYGAHFMLARMRNDPFSKLSEWFYDTSNGDKQERAWLLTKQRGD
jgi:hypothetical protein